MNRKGQHMLDVTTLVAGVIFIALALIMFSLATDALENESEEMNKKYYTELSARQFVRTFVLTPVQFHNEDTTVGELIKEYYANYVRAEESSCSSCEDRMEEIEVKLEAVADDMKPFFYGSFNDLIMTLMKEKSRSGTQESISFEIAEDSARDCKQTNVKKLCYSPEIPPVAIYLPLSTSVETNKYDKHVIAVGFITKWLDSEEPYEYDDSDAKSLD